MAYNFFKLRKKLYTLINIDEDRMNFRKTLLDAPIKLRKLTVRGNKYYLAPIEKPLPEPLVPTPYVPLTLQRPTSSTYCFTQKSTTNES